MPEVKMTLPEAVRQAHAAFTSGRYEEAERLCQAILRANEDHFTALHLFAAIQTTRGNHTRALGLYDSALRLEPNHAEAHFNRGTSLQALKRYEDALASYERALLIKPDYPNALNNRGVVLKELGRREDAISSYERALAIDPNHAEARYNLGVIFQELNRFEEALECYDHVIAIKSEATQPRRVPSIATASAEQSKLTRGGDETLRSQPNYAEAHNSRGTVLKRLRRTDEAIDSYNRALALRPDYAEAFNNRGLIYKELRQFEKAFYNYAQAYKFRPNYAEAHWNEALARLLIGDFERGWQGYEWRWKKESFQSLLRNFNAPLWLGTESVAGKTVLLHAEQGYGDSIQFCRYAPLLATRGARVILEVERPLYSLMESLAGVSLVITKGQPLPSFDFHCPLLTLPLAFSTRLETIPSETPYLRAPQDKVDVWRERLAKTKQPRVGIAWSGNPEHRNDYNRSIPLRSLLPLLDTNATFVSLQRDVRPDDGAVLSERRDILYAGGMINDFGDTAALISNLDLVISVDTSIAHLAGALGKQVWVLLPYVPDWRWLLDREDSPWYPSARLFRQDEKRDWKDVIARAVVSLRNLPPRNSKVTLGLDEARRRVLLTYKAGNIGEAEKLCHAILQAKPDHFDALHVLGVIQSSNGQKEDALASLGRAIAARPDHAEAHYNRGIILQQTDRLEAALADFDRALELRPNYVEAFYARGIVLQRLKRPDDALESYNRALALRSDHVESLNNRGVVLRELRRHEEALSSFEHALKLRPDYAIAFAGKGNVLADLGRHEEAVKLFDRALELRPEYYEALNNRGIALMALRRVEEALASYDRALTLHPNYPEALNNRGNALKDLKRFDEAMTSYQQAIDARPDYAEAYNNRGVALMDQLRVVEALSSYEKAVALKPDHAQAHFNIAHCRLLLGDFEHGWEANEWRWQTAQARHDRPQFSQPQWSGREDIAGKTVLLHAEQGLGDTIQFCRYARLVNARGARVLLQVQPALKRLLGGLPGANSVLARGEPLPAFDLQCPLLSLPRAFGTRFATIPPPAELPDLSGDLRRIWQTRLGAKTKPRIGIVWSGRPTHRNDHNRSLALRALVDLLELPLQFVSLQKDVRADDQRTLGSEGSKILHFGPSLTDFAETAALASLMDLIISVDTSVAHLAATLGRPTWIVLPFAPDWRWLLDRDDSPWYPSVRLFRQRAPGDWSDVIARVKTALSEFAARSAETESPDIVEQIAAARSTRP